MKKQFFSLFMSLIMVINLVGIVPTITVGAETSGDYEYEILDNATINITDYNGTETDLNIPSTIVGKHITSIGVNAFSDCTSLTNVTIPDSVISIGDNAFSGCIGLTNVTIPSSVTSIGNRAFCSCSGLTNVTIPNSVTSIENGTFSDCTSLTNVTIPDSVISIGDHAFRGCYGLISVTIPSSVTSIGKYALEFCTSLKDIYYYGSKEEWNKISCYLYNDTTIHYNYDPNHKHSYTSKITKQPTCTLTGIRTFTCECEDTYTETIPETGHNYVTSVVRPTYAEQGYTLYKCSVCGISYKDNYTAKLQLSIVTGFKESTTTANSVKLTWEKVNDADGYIVYKYDNSKKNWVRVVKGKYNGTYTVSKLSSGTSYKFAIKPYKTVNGKEITSSKFPQVLTSTNPADVTGFKITSTDYSAIKLTWNKVRGAEGYIIYRYDTSKKTWVRVEKTTTTANTYTVSKLSSGTSYKFAIKPYKTVNGKEITSLSFPTATAITLLPSVTGFKESTTTANSVKLTWEKVNDADGYIVYKYDNSKKNWVRVVKGKYNGTYTVSKLSSGTSYKFAIKPYKTVNGKEITSSKFPQVLTSTNPAKVSFSLTAGAKKVTAKWSKVTGASGYIVYYKTSVKGNWQRLKVVSNNTTSYIKTGLQEGKTYWFTVKAYKNYNGKTYNGSYTTKSVNIKAPVTLPIQRGSYLLNSNSMKVHHSSCPTIKNPQNYKKTSDLDAALNSGYVKCKVCF